MKRKQSILNFHCHTNHIAHFIEIEVLEDRIQPAGWAFDNAPTMIPGGQTELVITLDNGTQEGGKWRNVQIQIAEPVPGFSTV